MKPLIMFMRMWKQSPGSLLLKALISVKELLRVSIMPTIQFRSQKINRKCDFMCFPFQIRMQITALW